MRTDDKKEKNHIYSAKQEATSKPDRVGEMPAYAVNNRLYPKQGQYTIKDYYALPEDVRVELIDGVFHDMSAPLGGHQQMVGELYALLRSFLRSKKGGCIAFVSPVDVQLDCDEKTMVQPDVLVLCDKNKYKRTHIFGAPDFVIEIFSPSTRLKDLFIKLDKYRNAGVREYWMVDLQAKTVMTYRFEGEEESAVYSFTDTIPVSIFRGELQIDFSQIDEAVREWL